MADNNCVDVVDKTNMIGRVIAAREVSSWNCSNMGGLIWVGLHGSIAKVCDVTGGGTRSFGAWIDVDCLMTISGESYEP